MDHRSDRRHQIVRARRAALGNARGGVRRHAGARRRGELVSAAVGLGAWWNGARCRVSGVRAIEDATVLTTDHRFARTPERLTGWRTLAARASLARDWGDCYGYFLVATGRAEVMIDGVLADWDAAALFPVIRE